MALSITTHHHYADCFDLFIVMQNVIMLGVSMLSVVMLSIVVPGKIYLTMKCFKIVDFFVAKIISITQRPIDILIIKSRF